MTMKNPMMLAALMALAGCATDERVLDPNYHQWSPGPYRKSIAHTPSLAGWQQVKSTAVQFREYTVAHPAGEWRVRLDMPSEARPIRIFLPSGVHHDLAMEWYPEEGGADATSVVGFVKGDETLIILDGTSAVTRMETWAKFRGDSLVSLKRYAEKGPGMGPEMPGEEPKYKIYPPD